MTKTLVLAIGLACALSSTAPALAQSGGTPAKKALITKILDAQQAGIEQLARQLVEQPGVQLLQRAGVVVQTRVPAEQRQAVAKELQDDVRQYITSTFPGVRDRAKALAPSTIGPVLEQQMSEAELREVLAVFESAAWRKFQGLAPDMQKALGEKLVADVKPQVETSLKALDQTMAKRLGISPPPAGASGAGN
jgi:uncharacterized protein